MPPRQSVLPLAYRFFFLIAEPLAVLACAYHAHFSQDAYLRSLAPFLPPSSSSSSPLPLSHGEYEPEPAPADPGSSAALSLLASQLLLSALAEALVLRATGDLAVWRTLLAALLAADLARLGALLSLSLSGGGAAEALTTSTAAGVYWGAGGWDCALAWAGVPLVCLGAVMRVSFLCGVGIGAAKGKKVVQKTG